MKKAQVDFLQSLLETPSPTGCEMPVADIVRGRCAHVADSVSTDVMGSVHARLRGREQGLSVMLAAHMDEVSLMVRYISDDGYLSVAAVGIDAAILPGLRVDVHTEQGILRGVIGRKPIHLIKSDERTRVTPLSELFVDLGLPAKKVKKLVRVGDQITYGVGFERLGKRMAVSRAFDDKCGVWVGTRVLEELHAAGRAAGDFVFAATVQEEIGLRGGETSAYGVHPDIGLAFDVTHATDYPGISHTQFGKIVCGEGPVIARGPNVNPLVFNLLVKAAKEEGIPYQIEAEPGSTGTDAQAIQMQHGGIATGLISVPLRYMHTPSEVVCLDDLEYTVKLITRFVLNLDKGHDFTPGAASEMDPGKLQEELADAEDADDVCGIEGADGSETD